MRSSGLGGTFWKTAGCSKAGRGVCNTLRCFKGALRCFEARRGTPRRYKDRAGSALMDGGVDGGGVCGDGGDGRGNLRENRVKQS